MTSNSESRKKKIKMIFIIFVVIFLILTVLYFLGIFDTLLTSGQSSDNIKTNEVPEEVVPEVEEVVPEVEEVVPEVEEVVPEVEEVVPEVEEVVPEVEETVPEMEEPVPEVEETVPEVEETVPEVEETVPMKYNSVNTQMTIGPLKYNKRLKSYVPGLRFEGTSFYNRLYFDSRDVVLSKSTQQEEDYFEFVSTNILRPATENIIFGGVMFNPPPKVYEYFPSEDSHVFRFIKNDNEDTYPYPIGLGFFTKSFKLKNMRGGPFTLDQKWSLKNGITFEFKQDSKLVIEDVDKRELWSETFGYDRNKTRGFRDWVFYIDFLGRPVLEWNAGFRSKHPSKDKKYLYEYQNQDGWLEFSKTNGLSLMNDKGNIVKTFWKG